MTVEERFWSHVIKTDSCWIWIGFVNPKTGYGQLTIDGKCVLAHRFSYNRFVKETELCVLHSCDNRVCVRPDHLFEGTRLDNVLDMVAKNRQAKGIMNGSSVLTEMDVGRIRKMNGTITSIADKFGVTRRTISLIKRNITWRHI
jgi:hypothetical protein